MVLNRHKIITFSHSYAIYSPAIYTDKQKHTHIQIVFMSNMIVNRMCNLRLLFVLCLPWQVQIHLVSYSHLFTCFFFCSSCFIYCSTISSIRLFYFFGSPVCCNFSNIDVLCVYSVLYCKLAI